MNFPPIIFYDQRYSNLSTNNYPNQNSSTIISYQNLYKKLLKFENKDKAFQSNVISWLKSLSKIQLIKYISISNQWLVDVLHEMIVINNCKPSTKFLFNPSIRNKAKEEDFSFYMLFEQENMSLYEPNFADYFSICNKNYINLGKMTEKEIIQKKFIDNIRFLTISTNIQNNNKNSGKNDKEKQNEKFFFEYNNVVTLSYDYLLNIDNLIENMQNISNNELFKNPIEIETQYCEYGRKYYYNARLSNWLNPEFSLAELLCSYFEQSILINYQYYILYEQEINFLYYDKLEDLLDNFYKLLDFIGNQNGEKRIAIIQSVKNDEIKNLMYDSCIRKIITKMKIKDQNILTYYDKFYAHKNQTIKDKVNSTMLTLENSFIKGDLNFMKDITFIKNNILFKEEDFIRKIVFDKINTYWKNKTAEDLLQELTTNYEKKNNNKKRNKKKKKKNNNKNEEKEKENKDKIQINDNIEKNNQSNNNNELIQKDENKEIINNDDIQEKIINNKNNLIEKSEISISNDMDNADKISVCIWW